VPAGQEGETECNIESPLRTG